MYMSASLCWWEICSLTCRPCRWRSKEYTPGVGDTVEKDTQTDEQHLSPGVNRGLFHSFNTSWGPETEKTCHSPSVSERNLCGLNIVINGTNLPLGEERNAMSLSLLAHDFGKAWENRNSAINKGQKTSLFHFNTTAFYHFYKNIWPCHHGLALNGKITGTQGWNILLWDFTLLNGKFPDSYHSPE